MRFTRTLEYEMFKQCKYNCKISQLLIKNYGQYVENMTSIDMLMLNNNNQLFFNNIELLYLCKLV